MSKTKETHIETLITAESIIFGLILLYLSAHVAAWDKYVLQYQFYSITLFASIILYVGCSLTLFRSIVLAFQSLHTKNQTDRDNLYHIAYDLFLLVLLAVSVGVFAAFLSIIRQAVFTVPAVPIQISTPPWLFLALFLLLCVYMVTIIFRPKWVSYVIDRLKGLLNRLFRIK